MTPRRATAGRILPRTADNGYRGSPIARWVFLALSVVSIARSCIHLFAPDGGAGSIAGIDLANGGAASIVFMFALWGLAQLLYGLLQLLVALRYRTLIPLMYLLLVVETVGRMLVGHFKPPVLLHVPPGGTADYVLLPLVLLMLVLSLWEGKRRADA